MTHYRRPRPAPRINDLVAPYPPCCIALPPDRPGDLHCICGGSLVLIGVSHEIAVALRLRWIVFHHGVGHQRCSARAAWRARKKAKEAR